MPRSMRAFQITEWERPPELVEVDVPSVGSGQVLVRVAACGLCHSDLAMMAMPEALARSIGWSLPFTLGHEASGHVEAVGAGVDSVSVGDAVAISSPSSCGTCRWCLAGRENSCPNGTVGRGYGLDGSLAEFVLVDSARDLFALGGLDPKVAAPLTDAGATSHHGVRRVLDRIPIDGTVGVIGVGGLGGFVVQILRALSTVRIVAMDPDPTRRAVAVAYGADEAIDGVDADTVAAIGALTDGDGLDAVIDVVGSDETIAASTASLAPAGVLCLIGAAGGTLRRPWYGTLPRDGEVFTYQGSDRADLEAVVALARAGQITVDTLPYSLDEAAAAYEALRSGGLPGRIVVEP